jgi:signal transduction histidine kinase
VDQGAEVIADAPMLKVVLHNLISNALKFTRNSSAPAITIGHRREGDRDHLWVMDNGVGFDAKHKDQVFGVFKRLHTADQFEGTGVGLAIVHRIVTKHGGEVRADSAPGAGATIHISLPNNLFLAHAPPFVKVA